METVRVVCQIKKGFIFFALKKKKKKIMDAVFFWARGRGTFPTCDQLEVEKLVLLTE